MTLNYPHDWLFLTYSTRKLGKMMFDISIIPLLFSKAKPFFLETQTTREWITFTSAFYVLSCWKHYPNLRRFSNISFKMTLLYLGKGRNTWINLFLMNLDAPIFFFLSFILIIRGRDFSRLLIHQKQIPSISEVTEKWYKLYTEVVHPL